MGLPWFGDTGLGLYLRHPAEWNTRKRTIYGDVFKARLFWRDTILLSRPLDNHWLLHGEGKCVNVAHPWTWKQLLGAHSLSVAVGDDHARKRAVLSKAFTPTAIGMYAPVIEKITRETLSSWATKGEFQLNDEAKPFAFRMATSILLGLDLSDEQATAFTDLFGVWLRGFMGLPFDLPFTTFGRAMQARRQLLAMVEEVILRRRVRDSQRDPAEAAASRDILSILLHDMRSGTEETLSLDELKDQVLLQMFAGHDTTSAALTSLAFVIARYPDVRRRLQEEVAAAFPDPAQPIPAEALSGEYLNAVIKEVLRVYTPVGGGFRDLSEDVEYQNQWFFPKGWKIRFSALASHSDATVWPQPEKFDPERFLEPRREDQKVKGGYIPWGGGARVCLGQRLAVLELRMFAILLVRCYEAEVVGDTSRMHYFPFQFPLAAFRVRPAATTPTHD